MEIIDATLREGLQAARVELDPGRAAEIGMLLEDVGIRHIECTHAGASAQWDGILRAVLRRVHRATVMTHARACAQDIAATAASGVQAVGIFVGVNRWTRSSRTPGKSMDDLLRMIEESVRAAKRHGLFVRYSVEDASRTDWDDLRRAYDVAAQAGADRLGYPDTVGILEPAGAARTFADLRRAFRAIQIEVHLHNDRGLAMANALAAADAGIDFISTSVNGIGERAGITDTSAMIANLMYRGNGTDRWRADLLPELARTVAEAFGEPVPLRHPVTGERAFDHRCALHVKAWQRDATAYDWIDPATVGRSSQGVNSES